MINRVTRAKQAAECWTDHHLIRTKMSIEVKAQCWEALQKA